MSERLAARPAIAVLDAAVIERIAAGEVIDRPEAVVRELIDNSLDAGCRAIQIELRRGGLDLIRVADDGHGMDETELPLAFERHSTSKLRTVDDLARLSTLGFRGEALPAIAAVADVEIASALDGAHAGPRLLFRATQLVDQGTVARERGTTVWVRNVFASYPARLRFLRDARAEVAAIARRVKWSAVANPAVRFDLIVDGRLHFRASGGGRASRALAEAYGEDLLPSLVEIPERPLDACRVSGLLAVGGLTRPSRQYLALFVNRRRVRVAALEQAVESAYAGLLPAGRHPVGAIFIQAPPTIVDANVHPSKEQVRLLGEAALAVGLRDLVREIVASSPVEPPHLELYPPREVRSGPRRIAETPLWDTDEPGLEAPRYLAQLHGSLLLCEGRQGLVLVDQHRAHERVIFERLKRSGNERIVQSLLEPAVVDAPGGEPELIANRLEALKAMGFDYEPFSNRAYLVRSVPVLPDGGAVVEMATEALAVAGERDEFWRERLLATVACRSAVKKGRSLPAAQAASLVEELFLLPDPITCPHGSPAVLQLTRPFLRRQFRW